MVTGLLSIKGEQSISFYFRMAPFKKKGFKYGTPKPRWEFPKIGDPNIVP